MTQVDLLVLLCFVLLASLIGLAVWQWRVLHEVRIEADHDREEKRQAIAQLAARLAEHDVATHNRHAEAIGAITEVCSRLDTESHKGTEERNALRAAIDVLRETISESRGELAQHAGELRAAVTAAHDAVDAAVQRSHTEAVARDESLRIIITQTAKALEQKQLSQDQAIAEIFAALILAKTELMSRVVAADESVRSLLADHSTRLSQISVTAETVVAKLHEVDQRERATAEQVANNDATTRTYRASLDRELALLRDAIAAGAAQSAEALKSMREGIAEATTIALQEQQETARAANQEIRDWLRADLDARIGTRFQLVSEWVEKIYKRDERASYDLDVAREYWQHAPTGFGKISSADLLKLDDKTFDKRWREQYDSRVNHYFEERFFNRYCADLFHGKRVLSFGSGMGVNELQFLRTGTQLTCADIVETNLRVIEREAKLEGLKGLSLIHLSDPGTGDFGGPYDYIYIWGSLMTMPFDVQRQVMHAFKQALAPNGRMYLLLYTRAFLEAYCQVDSPTLFARASDPSVGELHNPWSDWHDDAKLMDLAGGDMVITHRQFWNQNFYVTYGLGWRETEGDIPMPSLCFDIDKVSSGGPEIWSAKPGELSPLDATLTPIAEGAVKVITTRNKYFYAAASDNHDVEVNTYEWITLEVEATLEKGGFSVGVLDVEKNTFAYSRSVSILGRQTHYFSWAASKTPRRCRIMISNHRDIEGVSEFTLHRIVLRGNRAHA